MKISEIIHFLEHFAPPSYQENYDNAGLISGDENWEAYGALISLDCTENVLEEAISKNCNLVISHHPLVFSGLKRFTGRTYVERTLIKAIKNNIALYAIHTNLDNVYNGVNKSISNRLGLSNCRILEPKHGLLRKLVTFCPESHAEKVRQALFDAGAGEIGNYSCCSFNSQGSGTFMAGNDTNPYVGEKGKIHAEPEVRIETIFESIKQKAILKKLLESHPYEEVAYDIYPLENEFKNTGAGMLGDLETELDEQQFLHWVRDKLKTECIRHTSFAGRKIKTVAVCGGAGSFLLPKAIAGGAQAFVSADFKYHQFFDADEKILIADIGHYESEQFTQDLIYDLLKDKFPTFALHLTKINTNPVHYFTR